MLQKAQSSCVYLICSDEVVAPEAFVVLNLHDGRRERVRRRQRADAVDQLCSFLRDQRIP